MQATITKALLTPVESTPDLLPLFEGGKGALLKSLADHLHSTLMSCKQYPEILNRCVPLVEAFVFGLDSPGAFEQLERELPGTRLKDFNDAYCLWETSLECEFIESVKNGTRFNIDNYPLNERFNRLLRRETSMLSGPLHEKRMLFIGSGPVPISAIWLNRLTRARVDCLDRDGDAVKLSTRLLGSLGLSEQIRVRQGLGQGFDVSDYDVIFIALLAKPKKEILKSIYHGARNDCQVICRTSYGLRHLLYEPTHFDEELERLFRCVDQRIVIGGVDDTISSMLLRKSI